MHKITRVIVAVVVITFCSVACAQTPLFVATGGNDTNSGSKSEPFATLQRASEEIRRLRKDAVEKGPITVHVRPGTYYLNKSLAFGPQDSGSKNEPVTWRADSRQVRLCGGRILPAKAFKPVSDKRIMARLDKSAHAKVVQIDLKAVGVEQLGVFPDIFCKPPAVPELFFNGRRLSLAQWPNDGWATIHKIIDSGSVPRVGDNSGHPGTFQYNGERPSRWSIDTGVWLSGYWCYDWYNETIKVKSIDTKSRQISLVKPAHYGVKQGNPSPRRYRAVNLLEELDKAGEYYIDRAGKQLYLWPPSAIQDARIVLSTLNAPLVAFNGARHMVFSGFTLESGLGNGMDIIGGEEILIEFCEIRDVRRTGINVSGGSKHRVQGCDIHDTGEGGLVIDGGDRKTLTPAGHEALDNHIWRFSRLQRTGSCGLKFGGVGNRAAHNHIHDAPHMAVVIGGNDHVFEMNIVNDVCTSSDDAGALYKGRNPSCRGNVIRNNYWHDIGSKLGHGTAAIYFDDGDGGDTVYGNIFVRCGYPGKGSFGTVFSHGGHDNLAENNIFIECKRALGSAPWDDRRWKKTIDGGHDCFWQKLLLVDVDITKPPYTTRYPALAGFMNPRPGQARVNRAKNNVFINCDKITSGNWALDPKTFWKTDTDPGFVDQANGNLLLRTDAEVFKRLPDFTPIPFDKIGPRKMR